MTLLICSYSPANVSGKLLDLREEFGLHWVMTLFLLGPLMPESQPGLNQISSVLSLCDGSMEIFSDSLLAANLCDDLQIRERTEDRSVARQGQICVHQSLLMLVAQFQESSK